MQPFATVTPYEKAFTHSHIHMEFFPMTAMRVTAKPFNSVTSRFGVVFAIHWLATSEDTRRRVSGWQVKDDTCPKTVFARLFIFSRQRKWP
jgi:hypothetical protein